MSDQLKYVLDETQIPKTWYNLAADLPQPLPPVLHPGTKQPVGPADLEPLFPMALILQEVSAERTIDIPEPIRDVYRMWRPSPLYPRAPARAGARHAGEDLLQVRRRLAGGLAQAEHRGAAGLVQQGAGRQAALDRDRRRPVGLVARVRRRAVRPRSHRLSGPGLLRPEALSPRADGDLRRALHRLAVERDRFRPRDPRQGSRQPGLASASPFPRRSRWRPRTRRREICARLGAQPRAAASDRHRAGSDRAVRDGGRRSRRRDRLHRRRLELRRARLPVPRPAAARRAQAPHHRGRAGGLPDR